MKLYKYCAPRRVSDLQSRLIRFTQAIEFNDPFDLSPTYDIFSQEDQSEFIRQDEAKGGDGKSYTLTPERLSLMLGATRLGQEFLLRQYQWLGGSFSIDNNLAARLQLSLTFGVLSLSESYDNLLMWSHYADQHRGFVIEFESESEFLAPNYSKRIPSFLEKVEYNDLRPHLSATTINRPEALVRKASVWAYEREWRAIKYLVSSDRVLPAHPIGQVPPYDSLPIHLFSFPATSVTAVITGALMRSEDYQALTGLISSTPEYSHVRVHHMQLSANEYRLLKTPSMPGAEIDEEHRPQVVSARSFRV
jgi:hypothetical protein